MGYTTDFDGFFTLSKQLTREQENEFNAFCQERHGGNTEVYEGFPGFWCDWETDGRSMYWNGNEKSYDMLEWANLLIERFLKPWGVQVTGSVYAQGEEPSDRWGMLAEGDTIRFARLKLVVEH